jgi:hypothetical protein
VQQLNSRVDRVTALASVGVPCTVRQGLPSMVLRSANADHGAVPAASVGVPFNVRQESSMVLRSANADHGAVVLSQANEKQDAADNSTVDGRALLSPSPRDLHVLWHEYKFGIGGRKPARMFTPTERGRCKYAFHRWKVFWDWVESMIKGGYTSQSAICYIHYQFGRHKSATQLINEMRRHRARSKHLAKAEYLAKTRK